MKELKDTVELMNSKDYKERFIAEYQQTKIRYEKLKAFCNRIETFYAMRSEEVNPSKPTERMEEPLHDCPYTLLRNQQRAMGEYLHILELRAIIEGIDLTL